MVSLRLQLTTFLTMIVVGLIIGIGFDGYRVLRGKINFNQLMTDLVDILFCLVITLVICAGLLYSNNGRVRIYFLLAVGLGINIYYLLFSSLIINLFTTIWKLIAGLANKVCWLLTTFKNKLLTIYHQTGADSDEQ